MFNNENQIAVNALRALSMSQIEKANSGHPGLPLGAAPMIYSLWTDHIHVNPENSKWINRDRFVLSAGHGSALLYSLLHLSEFKVSIQDLKEFRKMDSLTPGHPEVNHTDGVDATTGPLGQGIAQAVGMAMAEAHTGAIYNQGNFNIIDHYTYVLCGDGDLMEGVSYEASSLAGRLKLDKLIMLYDSNDISLDGELSKSFNEDVKMRFESQGWDYQLVEDGNSLEDISNAIENAQEENQKPSIIEIKTVIGYGSPNAGTNKTHGNPLGTENWQKTKEFYGWNEEEFTVPDSVQKQFRIRVKERGMDKYQQWVSEFEQYKEAYPELVATLIDAFDGKLPENYASTLEFVTDSSKAEASRDSSGRAIQAFAETTPYFWGGAADLFESNKTEIKSSSAFLPESYDGKNIWYGVREFAMGAILNGIMLHGGTKSFVSTFFVFSDYLKAAIRLAAISKIPAIYVFTHDSIALGPDGPTHQPIEHLTQYRAMPNLNVLRPADVNETYVAWKIAVESYDKPSMLVLSRQPLEIIDVSEEIVEKGVRHGAYVASSSELAEGILIASGSEIALAMQAKEKLAEQGINVSVVSMPSQNLFDEQTVEYQESVLPSEVENRMSIEMGSTISWNKYVGSNGLAYGIDTFGKSGNADEIIADYGFTVEDVVEAYKSKFVE